MIDDKNPRTWSFSLNPWAGLSLIAALAMLLTLGVIKLWEIVFHIVTFLAS